MAKWSETTSVQELSRTENWTKPLTRSTVSVLLECAWADRHTLIEELLSNEKEYVDNNTAPIKVFATSATVEALAENIKYTTDSDNQILDPTDAKIRVTYSVVNATGGGGSQTRKHPQTGETLQISERITPTAKLFTLKPQNFSTDRFRVRPLKPDEAPGLLVRTLKFLRSIDGLSRLDPSYLNFTGHVNKFQYASTVIPGLVFKPQTLLFQPGDAGRETVIQASGRFKGRLNLTLMFEWDPNGWNYHPVTQYINSDGFSEIKASKIYDMRLKVDGFFPEFITYPVSDFKAWLF